MPDPTPPVWLAGKGPGDPLYDAWVRGEAAKAEAAANKPAVNAGPPPGTKVNDNRYIEYGAGPNGSNVVHEKQPDGSFRTSYTSVGTPRTSGGGTSAGGTKTGGGSNFTPFPTSTERKAAEQATQGLSSAPPPNAYLIAPSRAVARDGLTTWTKDPATGNWMNAGFPPNNADKQAAMRMAMAERQGGTTTPPTPPVPLPGGRAVSPENPGASMFSTPGAPAASPFMGQSSVVPGSAGTRTSSLPSSVNNIAIQNPNQGFNGFINQGIGTRAPATMGVGPAVSTNQIHFSPGERGFTPSASPISGSYTVPDWLDYNTGRNEAGTAAPYTMGVTTGPRGDNSLQSMIEQAANTFPVSVAGNNVQVFRPDGGSTGFALNAMPASNIAMAQGRNFEGMTPQQQAAATALLLDEQMNGGLSGAWRTDEGAYIFGGNDREDFGRYAKGGRVATGPLGRVDQVTNEPIFGIGAFTGKKHFLMGEDNGDADTLPNPEMIKITPMKTYAEGGKVATGPIDPGFTTGPVINPTKPVTPFVDPGATTGPVGEMRFPTSTDPGATTGPVASVRPATPFSDPGFTTNPVIDPGGQVPFDPLGANILKPWQDAAQANRLRDANIRRFGYRGDYGGLAAPVAIQVEEGDVPSAPLGAGMYYDTTNQINRGLSTLMGAQEAYRNLAPAIDTSPLHAREGEIDTSLGLFERLRNSTLERSTLPPVIDTNPLYAREGEISTALELFDRMRNLDIQRVAAVATDAAAKQGLVLERNALAAQRDAANNVYQQLHLLVQNSGPTLGDGTQNPEWPKLYQAYLEANAKLVGIDTNLQQIDGRIASPSADVVAIDTTLNDLAQKTAGLNEGTLQTERGVIRSQLSQNQQRIEREVELNNLIGELTGKTAGLNEGTLGSERNLIRSQLSTNTSRMEREKELKNQVKTLAAKGVPRVSAPIIPVAA